MNKEVRKVKLISKNVLESVAYYSRFNSLYMLFFPIEEKLMFPSFKYLDVTL